MAVKANLLEHELFPSLRFGELIQEPILTLPGELDLSRYSREELLLIHAATEQRLQIEEDTLRSLDVVINSKQNTIIFGLSDLHFGSAATDLAALLALQQVILKIPNAKVILLGDEIDGRGKYPTNDIRNTTVPRQIDLFRAWLRPLYEAGKILCAVGEYNGHNGWVVDTNVVGWEFIFGETMRVPILGNGEVLNLIDESSEEADLLVSISAAHSSGKRSAIDPVHGLRSLLSREGTDAAVAGHTHTFGMERETQYGSNGQILRTTLVNAGAFKGSSKNPKIPRDTFGQRLTLGDVSPGGSGIIYSADLVDPLTSAKTIEGYPYATATEGILLLSALNLLNDLESQNLTHEILEQAREKAYNTNPRATKYRLRHIISQSQSEIGQSPAEKENWEQRQIEYLARLSREGSEVPEDRKQQSEWFHDPYEPIFQNLVARYDSDGLPFAIHLLSNLGLGAASFREDQFEKYLLQLSNPWDLLLWMRGVIDKDAGKLKDRRDHLDTAVEWMNQHNSRNLAMLIDGSLRTAAWKSAAKGFSFDGGVTQEDMLKYGPIAPASYVSKRSKVPLLANRGAIELRVGTTTDWHSYKIRVLDKLGNSGSVFKPNFGLLRAYGTFFEYPDLVTGGHMPRSAFSKIYDKNNANSGYPTFISPGWWREVDSMGKGNVMPGGPPEYSVVVVPIDGMFLQYPTQGLHEHQTLMRALTAQLAMMLNPKLGAAVRKN